MDVKCPGTSYLIILGIRWVFTMTGLSRLFHDHDRLLACSNGRFVCRVLKRLVPTDRWKGTVNRGSVTTVLQNHTAYMYPQAAHTVERTRSAIRDVLGFLSFLHTLYHTRITWSF